jgi:hypothetical protein
MTDEMDAAEKPARDWLLVATPLHEERRRVEADLPPVSTLHGAQLHLLWAFTQINHHHGLEKTRVMFSNYCREPGSPELCDMYELQLLQRLDTMKPEPNVKELARLMVAENATSPTPDPKLIPEYDGDEGRIRANLEQYIYRLKKKRGELMASFGPASPPLEPGEPARFTIVPTAPLPSRPRR